MKRLIALAVLAVVAALATLAACGKKAPSGTAADGGAKQDLQQVHDSFRQFLASTYGIHPSPAPSRPDAHACALQNAVMLRQGPAPHWVGQVAGAIRQNGKATTVRISFDLGADGAWRCDSAGSQLQVRAMVPASAPASVGDGGAAGMTETDAGPTDACAFLAASCEPVK